MDGNTINRDILGLKTIPSLMVFKLITLTINNSVTLGFFKTFSQKPLHH